MKIIIDDPAGELDAAKRQRIWDWFSGIVKASALKIEVRQTRWNDRDLLAQ